VGLFSKRVSPKEAYGYGHRRGSHLALMTYQSVDDDAETLDEQEELRLSFQRVLRELNTKRAVLPKQWGNHLEKPIRIRQCSICHHSERSEIDRALIGGDSQMEIAREHGVSQAALSRHLHRHLAPIAARAIGKYEPADADRLGAYALGLLEESLFGMLRAKAQQDAAEVRAWMAEARRNLELRAKLGGIIGTATVQVDVDARKQLAVLANLSEDDLRSLARGDGQALEPLVGDRAAGDALVIDSASPLVERDREPLPVSTTGSDAEEAA
jgi:transposase-like protein